MRFTNDDFVNQFDNNNDAFIFIKELCINEQHKTDGILKQQTGRGVVDAKHLFCDEITCATAKHINKIP